jgi:cobalamin synthase
MVVGGICLVLVGLLVFSGALNWFGRLPGDIRYEGANTRVYFPLVSMLIISLVASLLLYVIRKFL